MPHKSILIFYSDYSHNVIVGTVTLWSPNMKDPLVKMLCHRGPITGIAIDGGGWSMATVAMDARLKIWDIRSTYRSVVK